MSMTNYPVGQEFLLDIGTARLNVRQDGTPGGVPIVLIHALAGSLQQWDAVVENLPSNRWIIRLDMLGHGKSDKPDTGYAVPEQAARVAQVVQLLGGDTFHAAGHSAGGNVVVALLENAGTQHKLRSAVLIATPPNIRYLSLPMMANIYSVPMLGRLMWRVTTPAMAKGTMAQLFAKGFGDVPDVLPADFLRMTRLSYVNGKAGVEDYIRARDFTKRINASAAPVCVVFGAGDQWVSPAATLQWAAESRAMIKILPDVGHTPILECPALMADVLLEFIDVSSGGTQEAPD
jgi:pimeloyl-ACP methyl ester carboxylesterase